MLYIFQHIPKTAGTTFTEGYLAAAFGETLEKVPGDIAENRAAVQHLAGTLAERQGNLRIVAGHDIESLRAVAPGARHLTLVRDPIARLVSAYRHFVRTPELHTDGPPPDFAGFALGDGFHDVQARTLLEEHYDELDRLDDVEVVRLLAERFYLIGQSERLPRFIFALSRMAAFPLALFTDRLLAPADSHAPPSPEMLERICDFHRRDLRVCALAARVFETQTAGIWTAGAERESELYEAALDAFGDQADDEDSGQLWIAPATAEPFVSVDPAQFVSHDAWRPAEACPSAAGARVTTRPEIWSFAAELRLPDAIAAVPEPRFLRVDLRVEGGRIGLALCAGEDRDIVSESYFERIRGDAIATFAVDRWPEGPALIVRNASARGASAVEIRKISVLASPHG